jgi:hypothetical protein
MKKFIELFEEIYSKGGKAVEVSKTEKQGEEKRRSVGIRLSNRKKGVSDLAKKIRKKSSKGKSIHKNVLKRKK